MIEFHGHSAQFFTLGLMLNMIYEKHTGLLDLPMEQKPSGIISKSARQNLKMVSPLSCSTHTVLLAQNA
jgi:hypothetical protein